MNNTRLATTAGAVAAALLASAVLTGCTPDNQNDSTAQASAAEDSGTPDFADVPFTATDSDTGFAAHEQKLVVLDGPGQVNEPTAKAYLAGWKTADTTAIDSSGVPPTQTPRPGAGESRLTAFVTCDGPNGELVVTAEDGISSNPVRYAIPDKATTEGDPSMVTLGDGRVDAFLHAGEETDCRAEITDENSSDRRARAIMTTMMDTHSVVGMSIRPEATSTESEGGPGDGDDASSASRPDGQVRSEKTALFGDAYGFGLGATSDAAGSTLGAVPGLLFGSTAVED